MLKHFLTILLLATALTAKWYWKLILKKTKATYTRTMHAAKKKNLRFTLHVAKYQFSITDGELNGEPVPGSTQPEVSLYPETRRLLFWLQTLPALPYNVYVCKIIEFAKKKSPSCALAV